MYSFIKNTITIFILLNIGFLIMPIISNTIIEPFFTFNSVGIIVFSFSVLPLFAISWLFVRLNFSKLANLMMTVNFICANIITVYFISTTFGSALTVQESLKITLLIYVIGGYFACLCAHIIHLKNRKKSTNTIA